MVLAQLFDVLPDSGPVIGFFPLVVLILFLGREGKRELSIFATISLIVGGVLAALLYFISPVFGLSAIRLQLLVSYALGHGVELTLTVTDWGARAVSPASEFETRDSGANVLFGVVAVEFLVEVGIVLFLIDLSGQLYIPVLIVALGVLVSNTLTKAIISNWSRIAPRL